jgi:hypothetical protein
VLYPERDLWARTRSEMRGENGEAEGEEALERQIAGRREVYRTGRFAKVSSIRYVLVNEASGG